MDPRSESFFPHVELDLVRVLRLTSQTPQPFVVVQGIRTMSDEQNAMRAGHSTTMHSRHLPDKRGLAAAVDVAALEQGRISFAPGRESKVFGQIARQIMDAAQVLSIQVEWGGDWTTFKDWGHFQLPWSLYP